MGKRKVGLEVVENLGYRVSDIKEQLGPERYEEFSRWFVGQTGGISSSGELLIYEHDYERFLDGMDDLEWDDTPIVLQRRG